MSEFRSDVSLRDATVQEIQWELIRRTQHNALDGEQLVAFLTRHRHLWTAVLLDKLMVWVRDHRLPLLGLIKLRDLPKNDWNTDTLYILTENKENAHTLARLFEEFQMAGMPLVYDDHAEIQASLGIGLEGPALVSVWWD